MGRALDSNKMREHYKLQLKSLCDQIAQLGQFCDDSLVGAINALHDHDSELAQRIYQSDYIVDQKEREIENLCLSIILHQQPIASDLRLVSSALKLITDMERIGDQSCDIAEIVMHLDYAESVHFKLIEDMAKIARSMVQDAVEAFINRDMALAQSVIKRDDQVDNFLVEARELMAKLIVEHDHDAATIVDMVMIAKYIERIGDHATNVANWAIFSITGSHTDKHPADAGVEVSNNGEADAALLRA